MPPQHHAHVIRLTCVTVIVRLLVLALTLQTSRSCSAWAPGGAAPCRSTNCSKCSPSPSSPTRTAPCSRRRDGWTRARLPPSSLWSSRASLRTEACEGSTATCWWETCGALAGGERSGSVGFLVGMEGYEHRELFGTNGWFGDNSARRAMDRERIQRLIVVLVLRFSMRQCGFTRCAQLVLLNARRAFSLAPSRNAHASTRLGFRFSFAC